MDLSDGDSLASAVRWLTLNSTTEMNSQLLFTYRFTDLGWTLRKTRVTCQNACSLVRYPALGMAQITQKILPIPFLLLLARISGVVWKWVYMSQY
jgi:hypothetical protein